MKIADIANNPWVVLGACVSAVWWITSPENKGRIPDEIEPVTVHEQVQALTPLQAGEKRNQYNWAVRNIPYYWDRICAGGMSLDRRNELRTELLQEYANHRAAKGVPHPYESMTQEQVCAERAGE